MISFDADVCTNPELATEREWLETNGIGGFSSSTIAGINTRRYHGLLTASLNPPVDRYVLLSKVEETLVVAGQRFELSANLYPGAIHPRGFEYLTSFRLDPFPVFTYSAGGVEVVKRVFMIHGENTVVIRYEVHGDAQLELRPLIAFRDYHSTTHANQGLNANVTELERVATVVPYDGLPALHFAHNGTVQAGGGWYRDFEYPREKERGLDFHEDLFQPLTVFTNGNADLIVSTLFYNVDDAERLMTAEIARRSVFRTPLEVAADQFIAQRSRNLHTVIAGYHWFSDWGRDTMIALPGLTLSTGRFDIARDILLAFSKAENQGMLPNRFPDSGEIPEYNTVDASLWYFETVHQYLEHTNDIDFVREQLYLTIRSIVEWHQRGTRFGIHCGDDGLLRAGDANTQLTWMDAKIGDVAATPRYGKPVEIQALWFNALRVTAALAVACGDAAWAKELDAVASLAQKSFADQFWNEETGCLFDVVDGDRRDGAIRPNQVIALSLTFPIFDDVEKSQRILAVAQRELLTPYGLRTLAPGDPQYRPACNGSPEQRDFSYHQGTVWPWLLGPYARACQRFDLPAPDVSKLLEHMNTAGLGSVSEIFDGDAPHAPRGCIAQAWSVSELLRITRKDAA